MDVSRTKDPYWRVFETLDSRNKRRWAALCSAWRFAPVNASSQSIVAQADVILGLQKRVELEAG